LKERRKTLIISSHIFSTLKETCDEIYLLKEGELVKKVIKNDFNELEEELRAYTIGDKINKLGLK
jgi:ABC-2 type transport system ATP-binding protein